MTSEMLQRQERAFGNLKVAQYEFQEVMKPFLDADMPPLDKVERMEAVRMLTVIDRYIAAYREIIEAFGESLGPYLRKFYDQIKLTSYFQRQLEKAIAK